MLSNGDLILLTNEVNAVDENLHLRHYCAVAAACDHLRSDSRLMRVLDITLMAKYLRTRRQLDFKVSMGICTQSVQRSEQ